MELNKTKCKDCGHINSWHSYKWADTEDKREWNRRNNTTCPSCGSNNVSNVEDEETMGPYNFVAEVILKAATAGQKAQQEEKPEKPEGKALLFYKGQLVADAPDTLHMMWQYDDVTLEEKHDYIQWMFPLNELSGFNPKAPLLSDDEIQEFRKNPQLLCNVLHSAAFFMGFLRRNLKTWIKPSNHNHLRITRMLKFLSLVGLDSEAKARLDELRLITDRHPDIDFSTPMKFWIEAVSE